MRKPYNTLLLLLTVLIVTAQCASKYTLEHLPTKHLRFGFGGGITGETTTWTLLSNGQLFKTTGLRNETLEWKKHSRRKARQLFQEAEALTLLERPTFSQPGNLYRFVEWTEGERSQRITWGSRDHPVDGAVEGLYVKLIELTEAKRK